MLDDVDQREIRLEAAHWHEATRLQRMSWMNSQGRNQILQAEPMSDRAFGGIWSMRLCGSLGKLS